MSTITTTLIEPTTPMVSQEAARDRDMEHVVEIKNLCVDYRTESGKLIRAVDGLDLCVRRGEVVGFIGPNGAGKSTTIKVLMGFLRPKSGFAKVFGEPAGAMKARRRLGFLPEVALYYPFLTARETLDMFATLREIPKNRRKMEIDTLLEKVKLMGRDRELVRGFSKGMLQRVGIAQAIMGEPDLLILDEVTSGLDPVARYDVRRILMDFKAKGKTVFFSSHELSEVMMLCDRVILIDEGRVLKEDKLERLVDTIRRHVIKVKPLMPPQNLPEGVYVHAVHETHTTFTAEDELAKSRLRELLSQVGAETIDEYEEAGSLEDFFVRIIGHKVT
ncbi:MAG: ABC transporter ATP-binding protein [Candidatus Hydrogenedentes bacterium]|nr:ABC transporter ATP-binding protein [Candidatus Hydrogenedentota bacterium]